VIQRRSRHGRALLIVAVATIIAGAVARPLDAQDPAPPTDAEPALVPGPADDPPPPPRRRPRRRGGDEPAAAAAPEAPAPAAGPKEPPEERWLAIVGGTIHTVSSGTLSRGTILAKNGRIHEIGPSVPIPPGAEVLAVDGLHVYPGLVAVESTGIVSSPDDTDPYALPLLLALAGGVTTARAGEHIVKLTYGTLEGHALAKSRFVSIRSSPSDPKGRRELREALARILEHRRALERHAREKERDPKAVEPDGKWIKGIYQTAQRLLSGEAVAWVDAREAGEIREICSLAARYGFRVVLSGAEEGWIVAPEIAYADAAAVVTPRTRRDRDELRVAPSGTSIENAAILARHGVPVAIFPIGSMFAPGGGVSLSGLAGRDLFHLPMEAAFAVRGGLPAEAAVRAITLDAARVLGVDGRVGSIEVGKDADFVITDGDLLHYLTLPQYTVVNGRVAYDQAKEAILEHIRPGGEPEPTAPPDHWPRRLGDPW